MKHNYTTSQYQTKIHTVKTTEILSGTFIPRLLLLKNYKLNFFKKSIIKTYKYLTLLLIKTTEANDFLYASKFLKCHQHATLYCRQICID